MTQTIDLRYPIGQYERPASIDESIRRKLFNDLAKTPQQVMAAIEGLTDQQLDTPYRAGGWTARQIVHHLADANMNFYVRFKFAMTEVEPTVVVWQEELWAELPDAKHSPVKPSLDLLHAVERRWSAVLAAMPAKDFAKTLRHPQRGVMTVDDLLSLCAWHGLHHAAQLANFRKRFIA